MPSAQWRAMRPRDNSAEGIEQRTMRRVSRRLVPFLIVAYFIAYLDRTNLSFASLEMNKDIGLSSAAFGFGAGIFFLTYFLFEVPSNLMLERVGASKWIARIMITWGIISGAMAFVDGPSSFYTVRALLGAAEAGFFPGIIFYLSLWFPAAYRARIVSAFMVSVPMSVVIGGPLSGLLLSLHGPFGMAGWQLVYIVEAVPALALGVATFFFLTDAPGRARWLPEDERAWLAAQLETERLRAEQGASRRFTVRQALADSRVLQLIVVDIAICALNTGVGIFLPQIVKGFGVGSNLDVGLITAIPYLVAAIGMIWWGIRSDRRRERRLHTAIPLGICALGLVGSVLIPGSALKIVCMTAVMFGLYAMQPVFWTIPATFVTGVALAGTFAAINSVGNLAGFVAPYAMGWAKDTTGSYDAGLLGIAGVSVIGMLFALSVAKDRVTAGRDREATGAPTVRPAGR
ncbi:MAG TPA: MFS transporter [Trebonia sp.]|jgi:ACS family tartrate transporter-like MFS transporter|nr:MFS transporter [Trebonia sp.]